MQPNAKIITISGAFISLFTYLSVEIFKKNKNKYMKPNI